MLKLEPLKVRTLRLKNQPSTRDLTLPAIREMYSPFTRRASPPSPKAKVEKSPESRNARHFDRRELDIKLAERKRKSTPQLALQTTSTYTHSFDNGLYNVKTRPRFLGGQYSSKVNGKVESKFIADSVIQGTANREGVEQDCKNLFAEKTGLLRQERVLKELEGEFNKALERDFLTRVREAKGGEKRDGSDGASSPRTRRVELPPIGTAHTDGTVTTLHQ